MALQTSEMQTNFQPKLGPYVPHGLSGDNCHLGMTVLGHRVFPGHDSLMARRALARILAQLLNDLWALVSSSVKWVDGSVCSKEC